MPLKSTQKSRDFTWKALDPQDLKGTFQVLDSRGPQPSGASLGPSAGWTAGLGSREPSAQRPSEDTEKEGALPVKAHSHSAHKSMLGAPDSQNPLCTWGLDRAEAARSGGAREPQGSPLGIAKKNDSVCKGPRDHCLENICLQVLGLPDVVALIVPARLHVFHPLSIVV